MWLDVCLNPVQPQLLKSKLNNQFKCFGHVPQALMLCGGVITERSAQKRTTNDVIDVDHPNNLISSNETYHHTLVVFSMTTSQVHFKHARRQRRRDPRMMEFDARACESDDFTPVGRPDISDIDSLTTHARCMKIRQNSLLASALMHGNISLYRRLWLVTNPRFRSRLIVNCRHP